MKKYNVPVSFLGICRKYLGNHSSLSWIAHAIHCTVQSGDECNGFGEKLWKQPPNLDKFIEATEQGDTKITECVPFPVGDSYVNNRIENLVKLESNALLLSDQQEQDPSERHHHTRMEMSDCAKGSGNSEFVMWGH